MSIYAPFFFFFLFFTSLSLSLPNSFSPVVPQQIQRSRCDELLCKSFIEWLISTELGSFRLPARMRRSSNMIPHSDCVLQNPWGSSKKKTKGVAFRNINPNSIRHRLFTGIFFWLFLIHCQDRSVVTGHNHTPVRGFHQALGQKRAICTRSTVGSNCVTSGLRPKNPLCDHSFGSTSDCWVE